MPGSEVITFQNPKHAWAAEWKYFYVGTFIVLMSYIAPTIMWYYDNAVFDTWWLLPYLPDIVGILIHIAEGCFAVCLENAISQLKWIWIRDKRPMDIIQEFDEGTRGLHGRLNLLKAVKFQRLPKIDNTPPKCEWECFCWFTWMRRMLRPYLAQLAAITMVMLIAFSFIFHKAIHISERPLHIYGGAISRASNLSSTLYDNSNQTLFNGLQKAFSEDVNVSYSDIGAHCPFGECTAIKYQSLCVCVSMQYLGDDISASCIREADCWAPDKAPFKDEGEYAILEQRINMLYQPNEDVIKSAKRGVKLNKLAFFNTWSPSSTSPSTELSREFYLIKISNSWKRGKPLRIDARKFTFALCLHTYNTTVLNGQTITQLISQESVPTNGTSWRWTAPQDHTLLSAAHADTAGKCGATGDLTICFQGEDKFDGTYILDFLTYHLAPAFENVTDGTGAIKPIFQDMAETINRALVEPDGLEEFLNQVQIGYSNAMRESLHTGPVLPLQTEVSQHHVHIHWTWLAYPIMIGVLTWYVLFETAQVTSDYKLPTYKGSMLVLLEHLRDPTRLVAEDDAHKAISTRGAKVQLIPHGGHFKIQMTSTKGNAGDQQRWYQFWK